MKYAWQFARWFEARERKRSLMEAARRAKKPGVPLREVSLTDDEYATDWESGPEFVDDADNAVARAAAAAADRNASADPSGKLAVALEAARREREARGKKPFPEPTYDDEGAELPDAALAASSGGKAVKVRAVARRGARE